MQTLWNKGESLDHKILDFTVGNDREIDSYFVKQDIIGTLGHILTLMRARVLSNQECLILGKKLIALYNQVDTFEIKPQQQDEDVHSMLERLLTEDLGDIGKKVHTARSRNDQIATDISLWIRSESLQLHKKLLTLSNILYLASEKHKDRLLLGMTHLQPAMPSSIGAWLLGYSTLFLDDSYAVANSYKAASACPLGSAAGYGVPSDIVSLDRSYTSKILGFMRPLEPVTAVQGGRGKIESTMLFGMCQVSTTAARLARDLVLYSNPQFDFIKLPNKFTTGSSIMPQKRNPDVAELIRSSCHVIQACLQEVMSISSSVSTGYHRDFQRLKYPLVRGVELTKKVVDILIHILPEIVFKKGKIESACNIEIYATKRALELVKQGMTFRDAYKHVAKEVENKSLPRVTGERVPNIDHALTQVKARLNNLSDWNNNICKYENETLSNLLNIFDLF